jgi:serine/threonine protein kinase
MDGTVVPRGRDTEPNYRKGLAQFLVEARALARFAHPNIVPVDRHFEANGTAYMLREYEKGESLAQRFAPAPRPDEAMLKAIVAPLLDGLEAVHKAGVLHRDIQPAKIFIRDEGSPVLLEFGAARLASRDAIQDIIPVLTPGYAPVEQYIRSAHQGPWSDIYSMAAVLFWGVTGEHPPEALSRLRMDAVPGMLTAVRSRYSPPFLAAIQWGLAVDENRRPQNVREWRGALLRGAPTPGPGRRGESPRDRKYVWMALGVLVFFLFMAGADIFKQRAEDRASRIMKKSGPAQPVAGASASPTEAQRRAEPAPGGLTREEVAQNLPHLSEKFQQIDTDRSGNVTTEELQSYLRRNPPPAKKQ